MRKHRDQRGAGWVVGLIVILLLSTVGGAWMVATSYSSAARKLSATADLVALAAATNRSCQDAKAISTKNRVKLVECSVDVGANGYVARVIVSAKMSWKLPGLPKELRSVAEAGVVD